MKKILIKCVVFFIFITTFSNLKPIIYNQVALLQMTNYNQSLVLMNSFDKLYFIAIIGLSIPLVRDIYKTFKETKEKNK